MSSMVWESGTKGEDRKHVLQKSNNKQESNMLTHEGKRSHENNRSETQVQEECERGTWEYNKGPY